MPKSIAGRFSRPNTGRSGHPKTPSPLMGEGWGEGEIAKVNAITVLMRTRFVIARVAWESHHRSNGGSPACVQPHRSCHVAMLLAMTD